LWLCFSVYSGHHSILVPPSEVEANPAVWLTSVSNYNGQCHSCVQHFLDLHHASVLYCKATVVICTCFAAMLQPHISDLFHTSLACHNTTLVSDLYSDSSPCCNTALGSDLYNYSSPCCNTTLVSDLYSDLSPCCSRVLYEQSLPFCNTTSVTFLNSTSCVLLVLTMQDCVT